MTALAKFAGWLGAALPPQYEDYLLSVDGRENSVGGVLLYAVSSLIERNETYEVRRYCPGHFTVGDDGGGRAVVLRLDDGAVHLVDHGAMTPECMTPIGGSFRDWYAADCPLPEDDEDSGNRVERSQLILMDAGTATSAAIAKELRIALSVPVNEAMTLARAQRVVLMDRKQHSAKHMSKLLENLTKLGAIACFTDKD